MSDLTIELNADGEQARREIQAVAREETQVVQQFERISAAAVRGSREWSTENRRVVESQRELNRSAQRGLTVVRQNQSDTERLSQRLQDLRQSRDQNRISGEEYRQTVRRLIASERDRRSSIEENNRELSERDRVLRRANRSEEEFANIETRVAGLLRRSETAQERYNRDIEAAVVARRSGIITERELIQVRQRSLANLNRTAAAERNTFGDSGVTRLTRYFGAFASGAGAIDLVRRAIEAYRRELEEATQTTDSLSETRQRLSQVSDGDLANLERVSDDISLDEGVGRDVARRFVFSARSEDFEQEIPELTEFFQNIRVETVATLAGQVRDLFGGQLSSAETVEGAFAAARSSRSSVEDITQALPTVAAGGRQINASAEEQLGTLSVLSSFFKSPDQAAQRIAAFESRVNLRGEAAGISTDQGILEAVRQLQQLDPENRAKFLGESREVNEAFATIAQQFETIVERTGLISGAIDRTGQEDALSAQARRERFENDATGAINRAQLEARRAEISDEIAQERDLSTTGFAVTEASNRARTRLRDAGLDNTSQGVGEFIAGQGATFGLSADQAAEAGFGAGQVRRGAEFFTPGLGPLKLLIGALEQNTNALNSSGERQDAPVSGEPSQER